MKKMLIIGLAVMAGVAAPGAQDQLSAAKDQYAAAAYEDALSTLRGIDVAATPDVARQVDQYRAFCLFALGRTREAETVAESMIRKQPLAGLDSVDASPRLEKMFADVRKRLLPSLIREQFRAARAELDRKNFKTAEPPLSEAKAMIAEAEKLGVKDDGLGDLNILVDGFLQLIKSSAEQRPAPQAEAVVASAAPPTALPAPARQSSTGSPASTSTRSSTGQKPAPPASRVTPAAATTAKVYSIADEGVSPPITIQQRVPAMAPQLQVITRSLKKAGMVDVLIDEHGKVVDASIRQSLNATFDDLILNSATRWKYQPAMKDGVPVPFLKTILLVP
jgi:TonB-like protein